MVKDVSELYTMLSSTFFEVTVVFVLAELMI